MLRRLIEALRVARGHATDVTMPPRGSEELGSLARWMSASPDGGTLWEDLRTASAAVRELNARLL